MNTLLGRALAAACASAVIFALGAMGSPDRAEALNVGYASDGGIDFALNAHDIRQILSDGQPYDLCSDGIDTVLQSGHNISDYARQTCPITLINCAVQARDAGFPVATVRFYWSADPVCMVGPPGAAAGGLSRTRS